MRCPVHGDPVTPVTPPTPDLTALEQWARNEHAFHVEHLGCEGTCVACGQLKQIPALCETVRAQQQAAATWRMCPACQYEWRVPHLPAGESNDCPICTLTDAHLESEQAAVARAEQAERERDALMVQVDQWRRMADREVTACVEMRAERDAALAERDALFNSAWALLNDEPQANGEYVHAVTCSADRKKPIGCGGCSCQLGRRIKLLASALAEARRVLREVQWDRSGECPMCGGLRDGDTHVYHASHVEVVRGHFPACALAAVLAQEEK